MMLNPRIGQRVLIWYRAVFRKCLDCNGTGKEQIPCDPDDLVCEFCHGYGRVEVWRDFMPLHGKLGTVLFRGRSGKNCGPRNHCIEVDGRRFSVPCGNLRKASDDE